MTDDSNPENSEWQLLLSQWRHLEQRKRAPASLLSEVSRVLDFRSVRQRRFQFAAAALIPFLLAIVFFVQNEARLQVATDTTEVSKPIMTKIGPCAESGSCLDPILTLTELTNDLAYEPGMVNEPGNR